MNSNIIADLLLESQSCAGRLLLTDFNFSALHLPDDFQHVAGRFCYSCNDFER